MYIGMQNLNAQLQGFVQIRLQEHLSKLTRCPIFETSSIYVLRYFQNRIDEATNPLCGCLVDTQGSPMRFPPIINQQ